MNIDDTIRKEKLKGTKELFWESKQIATLLDCIVANGFLPENFHPAYFMNEKSKRLMYKRFLEYKKPFKYMGVMHKSL